MNEVMKNIFTLNLGLNQGDRVIVFTDTITEKEHPGEAERLRRHELRLIAKELTEAARDICNAQYREFPSGGGHGVEPHETLWRAAFGDEAIDELTRRNILEKILTKTADDTTITEAEDILRSTSVMPAAVVALSNYSTTHTKFRKFLTSIGRVRYASMPIFERSMIEASMAVNWSELEKRTNSLKDKLSGSSRLEITSANGTSITFSIEGRDVLTDTGILTEPGAYGNLPAGEAFLAPLEGTAEGRLVLEWAPTRKMTSPVTVVISKGMAVEVTGKDEYAAVLRKQLEEVPLSGNVAELGIGTNDKATRPDNILETEKILGTVHIALGDNAGFGGTVAVPFHQDFIFYGPTLRALKGDKWIELITEGKPLF
ncbi:MAG: aminopeptidase [Thermodesulfobacteriota bacterium]